MSTRSRTYQNNNIKEITDFARKGWESYCKH